MAQFARPDETITNEWTEVGGDHTALNEVTPNDGTYLEAPMIPDTSTLFRCKLSAVTDPGIDTGHFFRFHYYDADANETGSLSVQVIDGDTETIIATITKTDFSTPTGVWQSHSAELSELQAAAITNYANIHVVLQTAAVDAGDAWRCSWIELEVPGEAGPGYEEGSNPDEGPEVGGTEVIIYRSAGGLDDAKKVTFDGRPATQLTVIDDNTLSCLTPAHPVATVDVVVKDGAGDEIVSFPAGFRYNLFTGYNFPTITGITPNTDTVLGGAEVTITGTGFIPGMQIYFDEFLADDITYVSPTQYTCRVPPHELGPAKVTMRQP